MKINFFSMVMNYFQYLVTDYGFLVNKVEESEHSMQIGGRIEFETDTTFVVVSGEQFGADACVGRAKDDKYYHNLDPRTIHEYLFLTEAEKQLILSVDPKDDRKARLLLHQSKLLHKEMNSNKIIDNIENQLADYSVWLRQYAEPFLRGDFSKWLEIYEYKIGRNRAAYLRSGKDEFLGISGQDNVNRQSVFQRNLDYLEALRKEYRKT